MDDASVTDRSTDTSEPRRWTRAWLKAEFASLEFYHLLFFAGLAMLILSPFLALIQPEAGGIALIAFVFLVALAVMSSGEKGEEDDPPPPAPDTKPTP